MSRHRQFETAEMIVEHLPHARQVLGEDRVSLVSCALQSCGFMIRPVRETAGCRAVSQYK